MVNHSKSETQSRWLNNILIFILIGLVGWIYNDYVQRDTEWKIELKEELVKTNKEVDIIKKYILIKDKFDVDEVIEKQNWNDLIEKNKSNPRSVKPIPQIDFVPQFDEVQNIANETI